MACYPEDKSETKYNPIAFLFLWEMMATPEQKARRIEQDKVYELKELNRNLEQLRQRPSFYNSFEPSVIKKRKPDMTLVYLVVLESVLFLAAVAFIVLYLCLNGGQC